jgi:hypothetical protein
MSAVDISNRLLDLAVYSLLFGQTEPFLAT